MPKTVPPQLEVRTRPPASMRTCAADGIKKPKVDPLNSEGPLIRPKESTNVHNNCSEAAKASWAMRQANSRATGIQNSTASGSGIATDGSATANLKYNNTPAVLF